MAAVIHPTGTGKSLIAFKLAEEHPSEKFLWLSPSEYIYQTQLENLGMEFDNIQFMSYSRLMKNEDSIETLHPDYIILDEFHRCGAAEWGKSVRKLLNACPNAKRLGLSATNIRYLDNQRNMAFEFGKGFTGRRFVVVRCVYVWLFVHLAKPVVCLLLHLVHVFSA